MWLHYVPLALLYLISIVVKCIMLGICDSVLFTEHARGPSFPLHIRKKSSKMSVHVLIHVCKYFLFIYMFVYIHNLCVCLIHMHTYLVFVYIYL